VLERCFRTILAKHDEDFVYELPYEEGHSFRVCQGYGGAYSHTGLSHYSLDFRMAERTPVCAARSGVVMKSSGQFSQGGAESVYQGKENRVDILHEDGSVASYLHLVRGGALVQRGQHVTAGEVIGSSGNTGWSSYPHLHFHVVGGSESQQLPTKFRTAGYSAVYLKEGKSYRRPPKRAIRSTTFYQMCLAIVRSLFHRERCSTGNRGE
jgi:murein DD-endopeptidase MepM/ murein hydrolase activator NlpD